MNELNETLNQRGSEYGDFSQIAATIEAVESLLITNKMTDVQKVAMKMIIHKQARIACGNPSNRDSWLDIAGYATLASPEISP